MIYRPIASVSIFSKRDIDAIYLLSDERLRGMFDRLPPWMSEGHAITTDNAHEWSMENESTARSFPTSAGDSYTSTFVMVDEADLSPDLNSLLRSVKPTIDSGGKMVLLSRADKDKPVSDFKRIYAEAKRGTNGWAHIFLPWWVRPERTQEWYELQKIDIKSRTNNLDDLYEQYPSTDSEAMQPRTTDKRIPYEWLENVYVELEGDDKVGLPGLIVYKRPEVGKIYVIGADPAEGNPNSDPSSATVLDLDTGEEVAILTGKLQPDTFTNYIMMVSRFFNDAVVLTERNNHGHAVLLKMQEDGFEGILNGHDDRPGWNNTRVSKAIMYTHCTNIVQTKNTIIHSYNTYQQLVSIVGNTLKAPENMHDDEATSFSLAQCARHILVEGNAGMGVAAIEGRSIKSPTDNIRPTKIPAGAKRQPTSNPRTARIIRTSRRVRNVTTSSLG